MDKIFTSTSRYILFILMAFYTMNGFWALKRNISEAFSKALYFLQNIWLLLFVTISDLVLYINTKEDTYVYLLIYEICLIIGIHIIFNLLYDKFNRQLLNHQCMLLSIGLIMISRLKPAEAEKQLMITAAVTLVTALIPYFIRNFTFWKNMIWLYAILGLLGLSMVLLTGSVENGAKLSIHLGPVSIQPNEFVKIFFVLFLASAFIHCESIIDYLIVSAVAMAHIFLLVLSRDLGGASILFVIFLLLLFLFTGKVLILLTGGGLMFLGVFLAGTLMTHVKNRILAWQDPLAHFDTSGYQVSQSLFSIGSGGWFGTGLTKGMPNKIPVVTKDFIFAAITEEFGALFSILLIFIYISCFILIMNMALQKKDRFQSLIAAGFGLSFGFQMFLSIGGVIKFIPSTGVTLPFISSGGSSIFSLFIMFAAIQGMGMKRKERKEND